MRWTGGKGGFLIFFCLFLAGLLLLRCGMLDGALRKVTLCLQGGGGGGGRRGRLLPHGCAVAPIITPNDAGRV